MRVLLDTNVLVSAVATRGLCADILNAILLEHQLCVSETVLRELGRVLRKKMKVPSDTAQEMDAFLRREAVVVRQAPKLDIVVQDKDDEAILEEAVAADARVLVTGDRDLLDIAADSGGFGPPIPIKSGHRFQPIRATRSRGFRPAIPAESGHPGTIERRMVRQQYWRTST